MAEEEQKNDANQGPKGKKGKKKGGFKIVPFILLLIILPFIMPTLLILAGMIPTLVAIVTDEDAEKSRAVTVGAMNFAGVVPFLLELWQKGQTMDAAFNIILQANNWLIMLGAAAVGQMILFVVPPMIVSLTINQTSARYEKINQSIEQLKEIWGPDVATLNSIDSVRRENLK